MNYMMIFIKTHERERWLIVSLFAIKIIEKITDFDKNNRYTRDNVCEL